ncbi:GMC family oxidoreductase [Burkholderiaceae bacterium DAT-1]|nr:GMC family oxidoreductase [Burkholderiaceae bacterium DAT-1]
MRDLIAEGLASGRWHVEDGASLTQNLIIDTDVVIVGTGAGGGITAEILSQAGLKVLMLEEGAFRYASRDFHLQESEAYPQLYQESAARQTKDKGITIMQGRTVGGTTVVNWTSCFRTPHWTLEHWQSLGLKSLTVDAMAPWFAQAEQRLKVVDWQVPPNRNNSILRDGAEKVGISWSPIRRNVHGCMNLGYCGMGCAANAKQSMLVTTIPAALNLGARLISRVRVERIRFEGGKATGVEAQALQSDGISPAPWKVSVNARAVVLSGGSINTPAVLLRSKADDPHGLIGKRTFLHPVPISGAVMPEQVEAWAGAPQTIYSDHFLESLPLSGPIGYKVEVPPAHPILTTTTLSGFGESHAHIMQQYPNLHVMLALLRDGFHPESQGGQVQLRSDGSPVLDYPMTSYVWDGVKRAWLTMAELQFAAGAKQVMPIHEHVPAQGYGTWREAKAAIETLPLEVMRARIVSAHVMGGCAMGADASKGWVDHHGKSFAYDGLYVIDGSVFPTSIGANPQLSIYGMSARNAAHLAETLTGKPFAWQIA